MAEEKEVKVKKEEIKTLVVPQLPQQPYNRIIQDGQPYDLMTIDDALTEILETIRQLKKGLL